MTPEQLDDLIDTMKAACEIPRVYSRPLMMLTDWFHRPEIEDVDPDDEALQQLLNVAEEVATGWSFWPPEQFGSNEALIAPELVVDLVEAIHAYEQVMAGRTTDE